MPSSDERQMVFAILDVYRSYPCLWDRHDESYSIRKVKQAAYDVLLNVMGQFDGSADMNVMKKKIENLRTTARREYKKVQKSLKEAKSPQEVYEPTLYYYNKLKFLFDEEGQEDCDEAENENCSENDRDISTLYLEDMESLQERVPNKKKRVCEEPPEEHKFTEVFSTENDDEMSSYSKTDMESFQERVPNKKKRVCEEPPEEHKFTEVFSTENDDEMSSFGKTIGFQLKDLTDSQRYIAEHLISNVIFMARLGKLTPTSKIIL